MARIKLVALENMSEDQKEQYDRFPSNLSRALLKTSASTSGYLSLGASFRKADLTPRERELVIVKVACMSHSAYEKMQHLPIALHVGISQNEIDALENNSSTTFPENEKVLLQYIEECVEHVKVSDVTFAKARNIYSEQQIAEITLLIGHYMMTARFLESLEVDLDAKATSWDKLNVK